MSACRTLDVLMGSGAHGARGRCPPPAVVGAHIARDHDGLAQRGARRPAALPRAALGATAAVAAAAAAVAAARPLALARAAAARHGRAATRHGRRRARRGDARPVPQRCSRPSALVLG
jgi:4-hydroxybenzoate polyprenyltransferase